MKNRKRGNSAIQRARTELLEGIGAPEKKAFKPDSFQLEAIRSLTEGIDTLVVAPTGAGKTYIAVEAMRCYLEEGKRAIYTAPLKALSNCKYAEFKVGFEPEYSVGLLTGDRKIEGSSQLVVATTEIYRNELFRGDSPYSLVILDEFHYLADAQRGPVWEESVILSPKTATLLMLSASVSNAREIADWIEEVRGSKVNIVSVKERPVELRLAVMHPEHNILPLESDSPEVKAAISSMYSSRRRQFRGSPQTIRPGAARSGYRGSKNRNSSQGKKRKPGPKKS